MPAEFPVPEKLMEDQNLAMQNATRMTGQVCNQVISMNRAWFNLWSTLIMDFAALPKRLTGAQVNYIGEMLNGFEKTGREMGSLVLHAEEEAAGTLKKSTEQARRTIRERKETLNRAASALHSTPNSRRRKNGSGKSRKPEQRQLSDHGRAH